MQGLHQDADVERTSEMQRNIQDIN